MENKVIKSEEALLKAIEVFKSEYPTCTATDLQTFLIAWKAAEKYFLADPQE